MNTKGFTLLEVTLFLAISGALGLIAFLGLGPRLRNVRFTQSVRLIENTINTQFTATETGQNSRPANFSCSISGGSLQIAADSGAGPAGSSTSCVINGKMVFFEGDKMTFYSIVSRRVPASVGGGVNCETTTNLSEIQQCYTPILTGVNGGGPPEPAVASYSSGVAATFPSAPATDYRGYGYIQSPSGVSKYPFLYKNTTVTKDLGGAMVSTGQLKLCFDLLSRQSELTVSAGAIKPTISFEGCTI